MGDQIHETHVKPPLRGESRAQCPRIVSLMVRRTSQPQIDTRPEKKSHPDEEAYCRIISKGSVLSGTSRHCALSSASNCQVSPLSDISSIWPCSSRQRFGAKAVTTVSHFGFRKTWKLSWPASVLVSVRPQIIWPLPRTMAQSPIIWSIDLASERAAARFCRIRSEEHTSELQSQSNLV